MYTQAFEDRAPYGTVATQSRGLSASHLLPRPLPEGCGHRLHQRLLRGLQQGAAGRAFHSPHCGFPSSRSGIARGDSGLGAGAYWVQNRGIARQSDASRAPLLNGTNNSGPHPPLCVAIENAAPVRMPRKCCAGSQKASCVRLIVRSQ